jgi:hypothetical protein
MASVFLNTIGAPPPAKATKIEWKDCKVSFSNCWKANDGTESADYKAVKLIADAIRSKGGKCHLKNVKEDWRNEWTTGISKCDFVIKIKSDKYNDKTHHQHSSAEEAYINGTQKPYISLSIRASDKGNQNIIGMKAPDIISYLEKTPAANKKKRAVQGGNAKAQGSFDQLDPVGKESYNKLAQAQKKNIACAFN